MTVDPSTDPALAARTLMRRAATATLASALRGAEHWPYASLVLPAADHAGEPVLLLSDLAQHSRNMAADARVSLMVQAAATNAADPLAGVRATLLGRARTSDDPLRRARFLARHPAAEAYAAFADFRLYHLEIERVHVIQGFGRIEWVPGDAYRWPLAGAQHLAEAEPAILAHMNADHGAALTAIAERAFGAGLETPILVGLDPEGFDLSINGRLCRLDFPAPISGADGARQTFVALARAARAPGVRGFAAS